MQNGQCHNCGGTQASVLFRALDFDTGRNSFSIVRCKHCQVSYASGVSDATLSAAYSNEYYGSSDAKFLGIIERLIKRGHRNQADKILKMLANSAATETATEKPKVLDIGCGRGLLLAEFRKLGAQCTGLERDEFPVGSEPAFDVHIGSLFDTALAQEHFDVIVIWHVLEHMPDTQALLGEISKHLNPGGILVVSVPNFSSWQSTYFKGNWFHLDLPRHILHFEKDWLLDTLADAGFSCFEQSTFSLTQNLYGFIQSALNRFFPSKPNRLYYLLINHRSLMDWFEIAFWSTLAAFLLPAAITEAIVAEKSRQGATLTLYTRLSQMVSSND